MFGETTTSKKKKSRNIIKIFNLCELKPLVIYSEHTLKRGKGMIQNTLSLFILSHSYKKATIRQVIFRRHASLRSLHL